MSKVVTIPKDRNPFIVIVNGVEYKYPAGATIEVPDSVADVIEKYEGAKPKPDPNPAPGGGGGGSVDWDDIKNKPFGDSPTGGDTLYWDGNTGGLVSVEIPGADGGLMVKISDATPTVADMPNGVTEVFSNGTQTTRTQEMIQSAVEQMGVVSGEGFWVFPEDNYSFMGMMIIPKAGLYVSRMEGAPYHTSLTIPGYTGFPVTKKMEEKYLPGAVILYEDGTYLYKTEDTSDATKRLTKAELLDALNSGRTIYIKTNIDEMDVYVSPYSYPDAGDFMLAAFADDMTALFTAEYVSE